MSDTCISFPDILVIIGDTIVKSTYIPITTFMYFLLFPSGSIISIIVPIITAIIIACDQSLNQSIEYPSYLYIIPLFDILMTNVTPMINITDTLHIIARNVLNVSPIWSNSETILLSAMGWQSAEPK